MKRALWLCWACALEAQDLTGKWLVTLQHFGQKEYARLELSRKDSGWTGKILGDTATVTLSGGVLEIRCRGEQKDCGQLTGRLTNGEMQASGAPVKAQIEENLEKRRDQDRGGPENGGRGGVRRPGDLPVQQEEESGGRDRSEQVQSSCPQCQWIHAGIDRQQGRPVQGDHRGSFAFFVAGAGGLGHSEDRRPGKLM